MYSDELLLVGESPKAVSNRLEEWKEALKSKGLLIIKSKTVNIKTDFDLRVTVQKINRSKTIIQLLIVKWQVSEVESYNMLGSVQHKWGDFEEDIIHND